MMSKELKLVNSVLKVANSGQLHEDSVLELDTNIETLDPPELIFVFGGLFWPP